MKHKRMLILTIIFTGVLLNSCKKPGDTIVDPPDDSNLITNSSFESDGNASLQDWRVPWYVPTLVQSVQDAPPGGGNWSIAIQSSNLDANITYTVAAPAGTHIYKLSFWGKYTAPAGQWICQRGELWHLRGDSLFMGDDGSYKEINSTAWKLYIVVDTLTTYAGDSLIVALQGSYNGSGSATTYFDLCKLDVLD